MCNKIENSNPPEMFRFKFKRSQLHCSVESSFQYQQENNKHDAILLAIHYRTQQTCNTF